MKSLFDLMKIVGDQGAGAQSGSDNLRARDKEQTDPAAGRVKQVADKGLWQDVEFVPKIVEKIGE